MSTRTLSRKLMALSLGLLLVSCSTTGPTVAAQGPTGPHDLARYVLVVHETPDGQVTHDWKPLEDFDLTKYQHPLGAAGMGGALRRTSTAMTDAQIGDACFEVWERCMKRCKAGPLPSHAGHYIASYKNVRAALETFCMDECRKESDDCRRKLERQAKEALEFRSVNGAVDWLKRHKEEIAVGAVVIITGVAFYAVMSSGGILILAPVLLLASPDVRAEPYIVEAFR